MNEKAPPLCVSFRASWISLCGPLDLVSKREGHEFVVKELLCNRGPLG